MQLWLALGVGQFPGLGVDGVGGVGVPSIKTVPILNLKIDFSLPLVNFTAFEALSNFCDHAEKSMQCDESFTF